MNIENDPTSIRCFLLFLNRLEQIVNGYKKEDTPLNRTFLSLAISLKKIDRQKILSSAAVLEHKTLCSKGLKLSPEDPVTLNYYNLLIDLYDQSLRNDLGSSSDDPNRFLIPEDLSKGFVSHYLCVFSKVLLDDNEFFKAKDVPDLDTLIELSQSPTLIVRYALSFITITDGNSFRKLNYYDKS